MTKVRKTWTAVLPDAGTSGEDAPITDLPSLTSERRVRYIPGISGGWPRSLAVEFRATTG